MRADGRSAGELRPVSLHRHFTKNADGSVLVCFGDTKVVCTATVDARVPPWLAGNGKGWVTAEYAMLPGSASGGRINRDASKKGRALEISRLIGRSLRAVIDLEALGERQIVCDCDVLQADGGTRTAAITGAYVALHDAVESLIARGELSASPITGQCAAVSVGVFEGEVLVDLCYTEDVAADVDLNLVMTSDGGIVEVQGTAEGDAFDRKALDTMLDAAERGIHVLFAHQREVIHGG